MTNQLARSGFLIASVLACSGSDGATGPDGRSPEGYRAVLRTSVEAAGVNCAAGGSKLEYGQDKDTDEKLDDGEISGVEYVCAGPSGADGADGANGANAGPAVLQVSLEPGGEECPNGGQRIELGSDADGDGVLDAAATTQTIYVCNAVDSEGGRPGHVTRMVVTQEPAGIHCSRGGKRVDYGTDVDENGSLDPLEREGTSYLCDGAAGSEARTGLVKVTAETTQCATGGNRIDYGMDADGDGVLAANEVEGTRTLCHGMMGDNAQLSLVNRNDEGSGANCAAGGYRLTVGLDVNGNQLLEPSETLHTQYVCHGLSGDAGTPGATGRMTLARVVNEPPGAPCSVGGQRIETGRDNDRDGVLAAGEVTQTEYVCNGIAGMNGNDGTPSSNGLISVDSEPTGPNCASGGQRVESGSDLDRDGALDANEVLRTDYVCHGIDGFDGANANNGRAGLVSVSPEAGGANCASGGQRVMHGLDDDGDQILDALEVNGTRFVCNGNPGINGSSGTPGSNGREALVEVAIEPPGTHCANAGQRLTHGRDDDGDLLLDAGEITATRYVCNGPPGAAGADGTDGVGDAINSLVRVVAEAPGANCNGGGERIDVGLDDDGDLALDVGEIDTTSYVCDFDEFVNASFELPNYSGWTVASTASGQWLLATAGSLVSENAMAFDYADQRMEEITSPGMAYSVVATQGTIASVHTQASPGIHRIYQEFTISASATTLRWDMYYRNTWSVFDPTGQYVAVNIRNPETDAVIATIFKTQPGDPLVLGGMLPFSADLTAFAGQVVRLDFETNIQFSWLDLSLDNFRIE